MKKNILLNPEKKLGADPFSRFQEKIKNCLTPTHSNSEKWRHRSEARLL